MDKDVIPVRGQIVVVRNDPGAMVTVSGTDDGDDEVCYSKWSKMLDWRIFILILLSLGLSWKTRLP